MNICLVVVSLQCRLHIHASYSTTMKMNVPMLPLSQPNAVGVILAHGKRHTKKATLIFTLYYEMSKNTFHPYFCRQHWRRGLGSLPWRVRVWRRRLLVAVGPQGPPPLCYPGLWRPPGGNGAHQLTCESNQVNIPECTRWFLHGRIVLSTFSNHLHVVSSAVLCGRFSTDEGQCWHAYNFTDDPLHFSGMDSEPGSRSMNVSLWGYRNDFSKWVVITIDFRKLFSRECRYFAECGWWLVVVNGSN